MNTKEYHQLLKFLYFEGYADSYKEAEYIIEEMEDEDFEALCEEVFPQYTEEELEILDYLISEGFASSDNGALVILENMSEEWANEILEDSASYARRQANKQARGRGGKTPLYVDRTRKSIEKDSEGKWKVEKHTDKQLNPRASVGKFKQSAKNLPSVQGGGHGGAGFGYGPHQHGSGGINRGKKKGEQTKAPEPKLNKFQRRAKVNREKHYRTGGDTLHSGLVGDRAAQRIRDRAKKSFGAASKDWDKK